MYRERERYVDVGAVRELVAPAMGLNFYFAFTVVVGTGIPWDVALGAVAVAGIFFVLTAGVGVRDKLITAISDSLKHTIAVGIGLLIAIIGLQWAGVIVDSLGTLVTLGDWRTVPMLVVATGFAVIAVLLVRGMRGALLIGILYSSLVAWVAGLTEFRGVVSSPPSLAPTFLKLDMAGVFNPEVATVVFVFFFSRCLIRSGLWSVLLNKPG